MIVHPANVEGEFGRAAIQQAAARNGVRVAGVDNLMVSFARCCQPIPGDSILGIITRGRGVTIHREDCPNVVKILQGSDQERQRLIEVS